MLTSSLRRTEKNLDLDIRTRLDLSDEFGGTICQIKQRSVKVTSRRGVPYTSIIVPDRGGDRFPVPWGSFARGVSHYLNSSTACRSDLRAFTSESGTLPNVTSASSSVALFLPVQQKGRRIDWVCARTLGRHAARDTRREFQAALSKRGPVKNVRYRTPYLLQQFRIARPTQRARAPSAAVAASTAANLRNRDRARRSTDRSIASLHDCKFFREF